MMRLPNLIAMILATMPYVAKAQDIAFDDRWSEQRLTIFGSNQYSLDGDSLGVISDGTVSLMWTRLPEGMWQTSEASWEWMVDRSVPPTDLTLKGGDDRNLSLYFIFLPEEAARAATHVGPLALLDNPDARVLVYVWGGAYERGQILPSPYLGARGRSVVKRAAGEGAAAERVNLGRDHRRAFGEAPQRLVALAVSADSDDTGTAVSASISRLRLR